MNDAQNIAVSLEGITKYFPGTIANDHISLDLKRGEVLALLGENGAGKTTLMNILYGMYQPDAGTIRVHGELVKIRSPHDAMEHGIGMIHQHFTLIPVHSVLENIILGITRKSAGRLNIHKVAKEINDLGERYGLEVDPYAIIHELPVGMQQRVEILKALYRKAELIIMDEPTAVLTPQETEKLFGFIREFRAKGNSIIFISHKLNEVMEIADRIVVLRDGKVVGGVPREGASEQQLARMMVGRDLTLVTGKKETRPGPPALDVHDLVVIDDRGSQAVDHFSVTVNQGEIFGVAGVSGNGQEELAEALCGLRQVKKGTATLYNENITNKQALALIHEGVGYIPADRQREGLVLDMSVEENLFLKSYDENLYSNQGFLKQGLIRKNAQQLIDDFTIKTPSSLTKVKALSGGNQQKVVVARELVTATKLLVAVQPTRGLDVGAADYVHSMLLKARQEGKAILLISTELSEVMTLSDRIGVIYSGRLLKVLPSQGASVEEIGLLMAGIDREDDGTI